MTPKEAQGKFNSEFQHRLKTTPFPEALLPVGDLDQWKHHALQTESSISMGMPFEEYKVFVMKKDGYTLFEAAVLFNIIEKKTPKELPFPDYYAIQEKIYQAGLKWQELTNPIREAIDKKIEIMANNVGGQFRTNKLIKA
jgi:hypothetical protein